MSQPVKTRSSRDAMGTKSLMSGVRASVRLPRRMVLICEVEPMGLARPRRIASTPAIRVVATAPMPGIMTPSFPVAGLMLAASWLAEPVVDMLRRYPSVRQFSVVGGRVSIAHRKEVAQMKGVNQQALAVTQFCTIGAGLRFFGLGCSRMP